MFNSDNYITSYKLCDGPHEAYRSQKRVTATRQHN